MNQTDMQKIYNEAMQKIAAAAAQVQINFPLGSYLKLQQPQPPQSPIIPTLPNDEATRGSVLEHHLGAHNLASQRSGFHELRPLG